MGPYWGLGVFDAVRVRYRQERRTAIGEIVAQALTGSALTAHVEAVAERIPASDRDAFSRICAKTLPCSRRCGLPERASPWRNSRNGWRRRLGVLTSLRNPRVREVVRLRDRRHRDRRRRFVIEGRRELACAADAGWPLREVYHCPELAGDAAAEALIRRLTQAGAEGVATNSAVFQRLSYRRSPDGLLGVADTSPLTLADLCALDPPAPGGALWLVAAGVGVPGNLGAMLRSADAAGASGVLVADAAVDVFNPNVVRASMGALFTVPIAVSEASALQQWLAERNVRVVVAEPSSATAYTTIDYAADLALVIGSEATGVGASWHRAGYGSAGVPMAGRVDSLNAATTAAVLLFEARRQRTGA